MQILSTILLRPIIEQLATSMVKKNKIKKNEDCNSREKGSMSETE